MVEAVEGFLVDVMVNWSSSYGLVLSVHVLVVKTGMRGTSRLMDGERDGTTERAALSMMTAGRRADKAVIVIVAL